MSNLNIAPGNYITGFNNICEIGKHIKKLAVKVTILIDKNVENVIKNIYKCLENEGINFEIEYFRGECCYEEIDRIKNMISNKKSDAIVGIGGGKLLDAAKAAGYRVGVKIITVPTVAATCAAWSSHSAVYTEEGIAYEYYSIHKNPDMVFVDKKILLESPIRYTIAGIADTLAKWIETDAFTKSVAKKSTETEIAIFMAKKAYSEIMMYSEKALEDIEKQIFSYEVEAIFNHIIFTAGLVGGIGGEACRAVAAHALNNGFTVLKDKYPNSLHGEAVAFGNIVQLILDGVEKDKINELVNFYKKVKIPYNIEQLGYGKLTENELEKVINKALYRGDTMWNLPYRVSYEMLYNAIKKADLGIY